MDMVECKAIRGIDSTIPAVGSRAKDEVFSIPRHIAEHLQDIDPPQVQILSKGQPHPKPQGASHAGPKTQRASSSLVAPASHGKTSSTSRSATTHTGSKRSR